MALYIALLLGTFFSAALCAHTLGRNDATLELLQALIRYSETMENEVRKKVLSGSVEADMNAYLKGNQDALRFMINFLKNKRK